MLDFFGVSETEFNKHVFIDLAPEQIELLESQPPEGLSPRDVNDMLALAEAGYVFFILPDF
jgi:hypothetical protein